MKKHIILLYVVTFVIIVLITTLLIAIPQITNYKELLPTADSLSHTSSYVANGILYYEDKQIDVSKLCKRTNSDYSLTEIICFYGERIYFVYSSVTETNHEWSIAYIDVNSMDVTTVCTMFDVKTAYKRNNISDFRERNSFYYNGELVLNDFTQILVYNIESNSTKQFIYSDYVFPDRSIYGECLDSHTIKLHNGDVSSVFSLQDMAKTNDSISKIYSLNSKNTWDNTSYLANFFSEYSVQVYEDYIYAVGNCLNFAGESYGIILFYDNQTNTWQYMTSVFAGDSAHSNCYIVPTFK